jgi:diguanylate cyclase (GGDEF)-like protein
MADRGEPPEAGGPHPELGIALGRRAEECAARVVERLDGFTWTGQPPSPGYLRSRYQHLWFGTLLVARWLVIGVVGNPDELAWISESGRSAAQEGLSVVNIARAYLVWRDVMLATLDAEAERLGAPAEVRERAAAVVRATCDGNLMRMTRSFDAHLKEIAAALEDERRNLREATLHDQLTGLANRVLLYDRIAHALAQSDRDGTPLSVLLIDLDGFKAINDSLGHRYGDLVLVELGARLSRTVRQSDTVARLGGDEFVVVLPRTERARASAIAGKVLHALALPISLDGEIRALWASIGVAVHPDDGGDVDTLLLAADFAMYAAKRNGGGVQACAADGGPLARLARPAHGAA